MSIKISSFAPDFPMAVPGLTISPSRDGCIVVETSREQVHFLNLSAAVVLAHANGLRDHSELAVILQRLFDLPIEPVEDVHRVLSQLFMSKLVV